jgi:hypothetical protein
MPVENISLGTENFPGEDDDEYPVDLKLKKENVKTYGRVAKFPKNVKASNAFNFLENVKVSKSLFGILLLRNKKMNFKWLKIITRRCRFK